MEKSTVVCGVNSLILAEECCGKGGGGVWVLGDKEMGKVGCCKISK